MFDFRAFRTNHIHMSLKDDCGRVFVARCCRFINHNIIHVILNIFQIMLLCKIHQIITDLFCIS